MAGTRKTGCLALKRKFCNCLPALPEVSRQDSTKTVCKLYKNRTSRQSVEWLETISWPRSTPVKWFLTRSSICARTTVTTGQITSSTILLTTNVPNFPSKTRRCRWMALQPASVAPKSLTMMKSLRSNWQRKNITMPSKPLKSLLENWLKLT